MKSSFAPGRAPTTLEISFKGSKEEFFQFYKQSLDHLSDPELNAPAVLAFPKVLGYVIKPGSYIFLQSKNYSKEFLSQFLKQLLATNPQYLKDIILVGKKWLKLDLDWIPKSDANFNYIVFEHKILKVIATNKNYLDLLSEELITPQSWVWLVDLT